MHNTLTDPIIRIGTASGEERVTLPGLYAALMTDRVTSVTALRPHQRHALHAFMVQVGALTLLAAGISTVHDTEDKWRALLRALTSDFQDEPWTLIVEDLSKPALLQPPVPEGTLEILKNTGQKYSLSLGE
jgi:CRISPR system Cascade subunit CasA